MSARATEDGVFKFGDLSIGYRRAGEGQALILLHGFFGDCRVWRPQLEELSDDFAVVAWDAPGAGRSSDPAQAFRMPEYADCLAGLIEFLGLEQPCVVGLSFGATLALKLFWRHPEVPRGLVLAGAYAGWAGSLPAEVVEQRLKQTIPDLDLPAEQVVAKYIPGLLTQAASPSVFNEVAAIMRDFHPAGMKTMVRSLAEANLRDVLPRRIVERNPLLGIELPPNDEKPRTRVANADEAVGSSGPMSSSTATGSSCGRRRVS